jgi:hypothetical protein
MVRISDTYVVKANGITYDIDWSRWELGASIFIPCVDAPGIREKVSREAAHRGIKLAARTRIENQHFGVRFWRTA